MGTTLFLYLDGAFYTDRIMHTSQDRQAECIVPIAEARVHTESKQVLVQTHTSVYSPGPYIWHQGDDNPIIHGQGTGHNIQAAMVALLIMHRGILRLLGLTNFASIALPLAWLHSHPLQFWLKGTYRSPVDLFKPLKFTQELWEALLWWLLCHS